MLMQMCRADEERRHNRWLQLSVALDAQVRAMLMQMGRADEERRHRGSSSSRRMMGGGQCRWTDRWGHEWTPSIHPKAQGPGNDSNSEPTPHFELRASHASLFWTNRRARFQPLQTVH
jgi:hypothetical protein